ncbi:MAG: response regulator [Lachnospiraceae bacterium]|nr:response regulator [Lachnospiraceae bacterium]
MNLYKVMLVDDEADAREAIARCVDWNAIGYQVVAEAENGEDALEKAEMYAPDVVLTDIQMPFMDGLTFCRKLKNVMPDTRIIIFSGYDEFEYAQEAIRLEAEEYILKPINAEELIKVFGRIKERLDEDFDRRHNIDRLKRFYQDSLPILKEQFLIGMLEGRLNAEQIEGLASDYQLKLDAPFYTVGVLKQEEDTDGLQPLGAGLLGVSLKNMTEEFFSDSPDFICMNYLGTVVVIAGLKSTQALNAFISGMDQICKMSKKQYGLDTTAGIGKVYGNSRDIARSYEEAREATMYRMLLDADQAIYIGDVEPKNAEVMTMDEKLIERLLREIKIGNEKSMTEAVGAIMAHLKKSSVSIPQLRMWCTEIAIELSRLASMYKAEAELGDPEKLFDAIEQFHSFDEMNEWLTKLCDDLMQSIRRNRQDATRLLGEKAIEYIREHYQDSHLSVDMVCQHLGVGATYFSSIFKKETGMNFVAYLTKIRMEEAVSLLENTEEKSYVIAGMVGYEEPTYFSYVFKKQYGVSPAKYRQTLSNTDNK